MMEKLVANHGLAFGVGIVAGVVIVYAGYQYYKKKNVRENENLYAKRKNLKGINELLAKQENVATVDYENLEGWFKGNPVEVKDAKLMIAIPDEKILNAVGYALDDSQSVDLSKYLIQSVFNSKSGTVYKLRIIKFENIESQLQAQLLENEGMVILNY
jgi:hypothetical protein